MTNIEKLIVMAIVAIIVLLGVAHIHTRNTFEIACTKSGGEAVWDGRQYQCMKAEQPK